MVSKENLFSVCEHFVWFICNSNEWQKFNQEHGSFLIEMFVKEVICLVILVLLGKQNSVVNGTGIKCGSLLGNSQFANSGSGRSYLAPWAVSIGEI